MIPKDSVGLLRDVTAGPRASPGAWSQLEQARQPESCFSWTAGASERGGAGRGGLRGTTTNGQEPVGTTTDH